jgi:hypothetical protein
MDLLRPAAACLWAEDKVLLVVEEEGVMLAILEFLQLQDLGEQEDKSLLDLGL